MKSWQFYSLQSSIMIAITFSATNPVTKIVFAVLAVYYLILSLVTMFAHD